MADYTAVIGQEANVETTITNTDESQSQDVDLIVENDEGEVVDSKNISLDKNEDVTDVWEWDTEDKDVGTYTLIVQTDEDSDSVTVELEEPVETDVVGTKSFDRVDTEITDIVEIDREEFTTVDITDVTAEDEFPTTAEIIDVSVTES